MSDNTLRIATTFEEMNKKFDNFRTPEGKTYAESFVPEPTDIYISPHAKSGTTWTQQITHCLRTRGDMDFEEIMEVVPWVAMAYDTGIDLHAPQKALPRLFKSHLTWDEIPKGARYIYIVRNPKDVSVSDYNFLGNWIFETKEISLDEFVRTNYVESDNYWKHISSWWSQYNNPDVLFLCYEDMKADLEITIRLVARFMQIKLDNDLLAITLEKASFQFMKTHNHQFNDHMIRDHRNAAMNLPSHATTSKVKNGTVGQHKAHLSDELAQTIDSHWQTQTPPEYGLHCYDDLRDKISDLNRMRFRDLFEQ